MHLSTAFFCRAAGCAFAEIAKTVLIEDGEILENCAVTNAVGKTGGLLNLGTNQAFVDAGKLIMRDQAILSQLQ